MAKASPCTAKWPSDGRHRNLRDITTLANRPRRPCDEAKKGTETY